MTGQGTEVEDTITIAAYWRQGNAENALLAPLEVQAGDVVVSAQRIGEEKGVRREAPRLVLLPRVGDESVAQFVREICESIVACLANVHSDVGNERIRIGILGLQLVATHSGVGGQVEDVDGIGAGVGCGVANADGAGVQYPEATALVNLDAICCGDAVGAISGRVAAPIGKRYQLWRSCQAVIHVDVGQRSGNSCEK